MIYLVYVFLAALSIAIMHGAFSNLATTFLLKTKGKKALGTVKYLRRTGNRGEVSPVFKYLAVEDDTNKELFGVPVNSISSTPSFYKLGSSYTLYYKASEPAKFVVMKWTEHLTNFLILSFGISLFTMIILAVIGIIPQSTTN